MSMCPKCGKMLEDGMRFCDNCGAQILDTAVCPNCGEPILPGYAFCQKCGAPVSQTPAPTPGAGYTPNPGYTPDPGAGYAPNPGYTPDPGAGYTPDPGYAPDPGAGYAPAVDPAPAAPQKKPIPKKAIMFGGIGVAAVVVIIALVAIISSIAGGGGGKGGKTHMFYLRDGEIVYLDLKSGEATEVTSRFAGGSLTNYQLASNAYGFGRYIALTEDGSKLFYPDRNDFSTSNGILQVTLYYRDMKKTGEDPLKIDSDISYYAINKAGTVIFYLKGSDGNLYNHDLSNKEMIAGGVTGFYVTDDCSKLMYTTEERDVYTWTADGGKTKIVSEANIYSVSDDLTTIYYTKDDALYKQTEGDNERVKIASDVDRIVSILDTGELYYVKTEEVQIRLMDYVNDDLAAADAAITEPAQPNYPDAPVYHYRYDTDDEGNYLFNDYDEYYAWRDQYYIDKAAYDDECEKLSNEYWAAYNIYSERLNRDSRRETLSEYPMNRIKYSLYYYNGTEETLITDALTSAWDLSYSSSAPLLLMQAYESSEARSLKFSELVSDPEIYDIYNYVYNHVNESLFTKKERYFVSGADRTLFDEPDATSFTFSRDGSTIYYLNDLSDNGDEGDLYQITVTDGKIGRAELFDSDVSTRYMYFMSDGKFAYFKDVDNSKGDFYIDKEQIDYDVRLAAATYLKDAVLYYTDWDSDRGYGTLKMYNNGEKTKIADDVHSFIITNGDNILYLNDYSSNSCKGTLYSYNKGKPEKLDDDVMALISVSGTGVKGGYYYYNW